MITLAGIIGSGKSSLTEILSNELKSQPFYEPVDDNPVLPLFYKGNELAAAKRKDGLKDATNPYAYLLQTFFLNRRFMMMKKAMQAPNNILDRSIYEDAMFMRMNTEMGNATQLEYATYQELLQNMLSELTNAQPQQNNDLMVMIHVSYDTMLKRIQKRGRDYEQISSDPSLVDYYQRLLRYYDEFEKNYDLSEMLIIDGDKLDFVENINDRNLVLDLIEDKLQTLGNLTAADVRLLKQKRH